MIAEAPIESREQVHAPDATAANVSVPVVTRSAGSGIRCNFRATRAPRVEPRISESPLDATPANEYGGHLMNRIRWSTLAGVALVCTLTSCGGDSADRTAAEDDVEATAADQLSTPAATTTPPAAITTVPPTTTAPATTTTAPPTTEPATTTTVPVPPGTYGDHVTQVIAIRPTTSSDEGAVGPLFLATGHDSVWVAIHRASAVSRVDPDTGEVISTIAIDPTPGSTAETEIVNTGAATGTGSVLATDDAVWVADVGGFIWRIDPATEHIVARIEHPGLRAEAGLLEAHGSIWALAEDGAAVRIDPSTNQAVADLTLSHPGCCNGPQLAATPDAVWVGSDGGAIRVDPTANAETALVDIEPYGLGASPLGTNDGLVWGVRPFKIWAIDPTTNEVVRTIDKPADTGALYSDSAVLDDGVLWVLAAPEGDELGADRWFQLVRFDLATGATEHFDLVNAEFDFIVGLAVADGAVWATDFARGNLLRVEAG